MFKINKEYLRKSIYTRVACTGMQKKNYIRKTMKSVKKKENCLEYQFLRLTKLINKKYQFIFTKNIYTRANTQKKKNNNNIYIYIYIKNYKMFQNI